MAGLTGEPWLITNDFQLDTPVIALVPTGFGFAMAATTINSAICSWGSSLRCDGC